MADDPSKTTPPDDPGKGNPTDPKGDNPPPKEDPKPVDPAVHAKIVEEFNALQKQIKEQAAEQKKKAKEREEKRLASLETEERAKEIEAKYGEISGKYETQTEELESYREWAKERAETALSALEPEDRDLVEELAGEDPRSIFSMIQKLESSGKIGGHKAPDVDRTRAGAGGNPPKLPDNPWKAADIQLQRELQQKRKLRRR